MHFHLRRALDLRGMRAYRFAAKAGCGLYLEPAVIKSKLEIPLEIPSSRFPGSNKHADTKADFAVGCALCDVASRWAIPGSASPASGHARCGSGRKPNPRPIHDLPN